MFEQLIQPVNRTLQKSLIGLVRCYQVCLSPWFAPRCRFYPTCSNYAKTAILQHGTFKGLLLTIGRLLRCQPFCAGGCDPVPSIKRDKQ